MGIAMFYVPLSASFWALLQNVVLWLFIGAGVGVVLGAVLQIIKR